MSVLNVFKSLLFTPIKSTYWQSALSNSFSQWISTNTSKFNFFASFDRFFISFFVKAEAINSITSAPNDLDSII